MASNSEWSTSDILSKILIDSLVRGWGKIAYSILSKERVIAGMAGNQEANQLLEVFIDTEGTQNWQALRSARKGTPLVGYVADLQAKLDGFPIQNPQAELPKVCQQVVNAYGMREAKNKAHAIWELSRNPAITYEALMSAFQDLATWQPNHDESGIIMIGEAVADFMEHDMKAMQAGDIQKLCVPTGLYQLDRYLYGLPRGGYTIIAGNTGTGKSSLASEITARLKGRALYASGEMTPKQLVGRMISARSGWSRQSMMENVANWEDVRQAGRELSQLNIAFNEKPQLSLRGIERWFKRFNSEQPSETGIDLVVVDYSRLVKIEGNSKLDQAENLGVQLKQLASSLTNPDGSHPAFIVVWDGNRQNINQGRVEWRLSDIAYGGEKDADSVICFTNPCWLVDQGQVGAVRVWVERHNARYIHEIKRGEIEPVSMDMFEGPHRMESYTMVDILKNRWGKVRETRLYFNAALTAFDDAPVPKVLDDDVKDIPF